MRFRRILRSLMSLTAAYALALQAIFAASILIGHYGETAFARAEICAHGTSEPGGGLPADRMPCCACPACSAAADGAATLPSLSGCPIPLQVRERVAAATPAFAARPAIRAPQNPRAPPLSA